MAWKFEPVLLDGKPARARSQMSLLVVANRLAKEEVAIRIRNASFDGGGPQEGEVLSALTMKPPSYPESIAAAGVSGIVYVVAEQVNLRAIGKDKVMTAWRSILSDAALRAARTWTFKLPTSGSQASAAYWSARVPTDFRMGDDTDPYGKWQIYLPGPRQEIPWSREEAGASPDSFAEGGVYMLGQNSGPKLLTPLDGT